MRMRSIPTALHTSNLLNPPRFDGQLPQMISAGSATTRHLHRITLYVPSRPRALDEMHRYLCLKCLFDNFIRLRLNIGGVRARHEAAFDIEACYFEPKRRWPGASIPHIGCRLLGDTQYRSAL